MFDWSEWDKRWLHHLLVFNISALLEPHTQTSFGTDFNIYCLQGNVSFGQPLHRRSDQTGRSAVNHPEKEAELDSWGWKQPPHDRACVYTERVRPCLYSGLNKPQPSALSLRYHSNISFLCTISSKNVCSDECTFKPLLLDKYMHRLKRPPGGTASRLRWVPVSL